MTTLGPTLRGTYDASKHGEHDSNVEDVQELHSLRAGHMDVAPVRCTMEGKAVGDQVSGKQSLLGSPHKPSH